MNTAKGTKPKTNEKVNRMNTYYVLMIDNISGKAFINTVKADSLNEAKMLSSMEWGDSCTVAF